MQTSRRTFLETATTTAVAMVTGLASLIFPAREVQAREGKDVLKALVDAGCTDQDGNKFTGDQVKGKMFLQGAGFQFCEFCANTLAPAQSKVLSKLPRDTKFVIINTRADTKPDAYLDKLAKAGIDTDNVIILFPPGKTDEEKEANAKKMQTAVGDVPGVGPRGTHTFIINLVGKDGVSKFAQSCNVEGTDANDLAEKFGKAAGGIGR